MSVSEHLTHFETITKTSFNKLTSRKGLVFVLSLFGARGCSRLTVDHGVTEVNGSVDLMPLAGRCKGWVCGSSHPGIACSNPAKVLDVCLL